MADHRSAAQPFRLTIEFPHGQAPEGTSVVFDNREAGAMPAQDPRPVAVERDPEASRTAALFEEMLVPPPIPGPPPGFDPTILSPMFPESVPISTTASPILREPLDVESLVASPIEELPDSFEPGSLLERYRSDSPRPKEERFTVPDIPSTRKARAPRIDRDDEAPEPPAVPDDAVEPTSGSATVPEILPEPVPEILPDAMPEAVEFEPQPEWIPPAPASLQPHEPIPITPVVPTWTAPYQDRKGLRGLLRNFRSVPPPPASPQPFVPIEPGETIPEVIPRRPGSVPPSDVLRQTDALFRGDPTPEPPPRSPAIAPDWDPAIRPDRGPIEIPE